MDLSIYLPIFVSRYLDIYLYIYTSIYIGIYLPIYLPIYTSIYISIYALEDGVVYGGGVPLEGLEDQVAHPREHKVKHPHSIIV